MQWTSFKAVLKKSYCAFLEHWLFLFDRTYQLLIDKLSCSSEHFITSENTLVMPLADNSLSISVYCKPTHTDQYLQWDSYHSLSAKYSVISTLTHRAKTVCTDPELLQKELTHLRKALGKCNYPTWAINRVQNKVLNNNWEDHSNNSPTNQNNNNNSQVPATQTGDNNNNQTQNNNQGTNPLPATPRNKSTVGQVVIPYTKGIAEGIKQQSCS